MNKISDKLHPIMAKYRLAMAKELRKIHRLILDNNNHIRIIKGIKL